MTRALTTVKHWLLGLLLGTALYWLVLRPLALWAWGAF